MRKLQRGRRNLWYDCNISNRSLYTYMLCVKYVKGHAVRNTLTSFRRKLHWRSMCRQLSPVRDLKITLWEKQALNVDTGGEYLKRNLCNTFHFYGKWISLACASSTSRQPREDLPHATGEAAQMLIQVLIITRLLLQVPARRSPCVCHQSSADSPECCCSADLQPPIPTSLLFPTHHTVVVCIRGSGAGLQGSGAVWLQAMVKPYTLVHPLATCNLY